jgi:hypothetical protein
LTVCPLYLPVAVLCGIGIDIDEQRGKKVICSFCFLFIGLSFHFLEELFKPISTTFYDVGSLGNGPIGDGFRLILNRIGIGTVTLEIDL